MLAAHTALKVRSRCNLTFKYGQSAMERTTSAGSPGFPEECLAATSATRNLVAIQAPAIL